jgi:hypothetical protein
MDILAPGTVKASPFRELMQDECWTSQLHSATHNHHAATPRTTMYNTNRAASSCKHRIMFHACLTSGIYWTSCKPTTWVLLCLPLPSTVGIILPWSEVNCTTHVCYNPTVQHGVCSVLNDFSFSFLQISLPLVLLLPTKLTGVTSKERDFSQIWRWTQPGEF